MAGPPPPGDVAPDDLYEALVHLHDDLTQHDCLLASSKLILLLADRIGDLGAVRALVERVSFSMQHRRCRDRADG